MTKNKGFTLIELLVVIAIIGILSTLAVVSLQSARSRARDAKRVSDIKQIQTALELYFNDNGSYPLTGEIDYSIATGGSVYMNKVPIAPNPPDGDCDDDDNKYEYTSSLDGSSYLISFCLGSQVGQLESGDKEAKPQGIFSKVISSNTYKLTFEKVTGSVGTVQSSPAGLYCSESEIECSYDFDEGEIVIVEVNNSFFCDWIQCESPNNNFCTVNMDQDKLIRATVSPGICAPI